jgi:mycofactocin system FadH/OYE family oxidoreductase 2
MAHQFQFQHLFSPFKIRNVEFRNRVMVSAHLTCFAADGMPTEQQAAYFAERAKGGVALIVMALNIVHKNSYLWRAVEAAFDDAIVPKYRMVTDAVHAHGAKIFCQLAHLGRQSWSLYSKEPLVSASDIPCPAMLEMPKRAEPEDIEEIIQGFADAAVRAKQGGFDGVEIHSSYGGYLIAQFLSPYSNRRDDDWGGALENRMRLLKQILTRVRAAVGEDFVVGMQLVGDEFTPHGLTLADTKVIAREIEQRTSVDYILVKAGTFYSSNNIVPDMQHPHGVFLPLATGIRESVKRVPIFAVGRITDPMMAEQILADGHADMIAMTRAHIADAELLMKVKEGRLEDIRECIGCNQGCIDTVYKQMHVGCIHNPAAGEERTLGMGTLRSAATPKKVVVVGGGPAGMKAAEIAARRGHHVTLVEKADALGGQVLVAARVPLREEFRGIVRYLDTQLGKLPVTVRLNTAATAASLLAMKPDAVVVATGSTPRTLGYQNIRPDITAHAGVGQENVLFAHDAILHPERVGRKVLLVEDGESNWKVLSAAIYLAEQGKRVEIITSLFYTGTRIGGNSIGILYAKLFKLGVKLTPMTGFLGIQGNTATLFHAFTNEERQEDYDTVVLCFYNKANDDLYFGLKGKVRELVRIGDCLAPRDAQAAVREGELAARAL